MVSFIISNTHAARSGWHLWEIDSRFALKSTLITSNPQISVVNQLLSFIDGVDALNNILIIGMTNRKDMLDEALLRPGRLEVQFPSSPRDTPHLLPARKCYPPSSLRSAPPGLPPTPPPPSSLRGVPPLLRRCFWILGLNPGYC